MSSALRLAVGTLTVIPTGAVDVTPTVAGRAMTLAPLAVLPLALATAAVAWVGPALGAPGPLVGVAAVAVLALGTRALHLDGLADTADGLGSGWDRDRALAVMKRGDVGPMGVVTLVLVLLAQVVAIGSWAGDLRGAVLLGVLVCGSRCAVPTVCVRGVPAARTDGLGAAVAGTVSPVAVVLGWVAATGVLLLVLLPVGVGPILLVLVVPLVAVAVVLLLLRTGVRRFGGITGDVVGAAVEAAFTALVVTVAVLA